MRTWNDTYEILKSYYNEFGHTLVKYEETYKDVNLGYWVALQRSKFHKNSLTNEQVALLEDIGFVFSIHNNSWDVHFALCEEYKDTFGNIDIPKRYVVVKDGTTYHLGKWLANQRLAYSNNYSDRTISLVHINKLEKLGIHWNTTRNTIHSISFNECAIAYYFKKLFPNTTKYLKDGVELDVFIPELNLAIEYDGQAWHTKERDLKKNEYCKEHNISLIRIREMGCDTLNSTSYDYYINAKDIHSLETILKSFLPVVDIDIVRDMKDIYDTYFTTIEQSWKDKYALCVNYFNTHNALDFKTNYVTSDNVKLGCWLNEQRKLYKKNRLSSHKVELLEKLNIAWSIYHKAA